MFVAATLPWMTKGISSLVIVLIAYGLLNRYRPRVHVPVMVACFVLDLANVVIIEVSRLLQQGQGAVARSYESLGEGWTLLNFHILVSVLTLVSYGVALYSGVRLLRRGVGRGLHRSNAFVFLVLRLANYVTSFMV